MKRKTLVFGLGGALAFAGVLYASAHAGHRRTPRPPGMVLRVVEPEAESSGSFVEPSFVIEVASVEPPSIAVLRADLGHGWVRATYAYPSGELLDSQRVSKLDPQPTRRFDFDGDGITDEIECGYREDRGRVRVLSGANRAVLFEDFDDLEYEDPDRAFALGDLDGDGFSELALAHPRFDRSTYDIELWDALLGAHSWITVVSGARVARR